MILISQIKVQIVLIKIQEWLTTLLNTDEHQYKLDSLVKSTSYQILLNSNTYKNVVDKMTKFLANGNKYNNDNYFRYSYNKVEYINYSNDIGIYGNLEKLINKKLMLILIQLLQKKLLIKLFETKIFTSCSDSELRGAKDLNVNENTINYLIINNPYGYLPNNVNQFLYLINYGDLNTIFNVTGINNLKANFDDVKGTITILITTNNDKYQLALSKENINNKIQKENDYYQYIYNRCLVITSPQWNYERNSNTHQLLIN